MDFSNLESKVQSQTQTQNKFSSLESKVGTATTGSPQSNLTQKINDALAKKNQFLPNGISVYSDNMRQKLKAMGKSDKDIETIMANVPDSQSRFKQGVEWGTQAFDYGKKMAGAGFSDIATGITGKPTYDPKTGKINQPEQGFLGRTGQTFTGVGEMIAGGFAGGFSPLAGLMGLAAPEIKSGVQKLVDSGALTPEKGSLAEKGIQWYQGLPEDQKTQAQALLDLVSAGLGTRGARQTARIASDVAPATIKTAENMAVKSFDTAINAGEKIKSAVIKTPEAESIVGKILQGKTGDIEAGKKALQEMDLSGVKTYDDLKNAAENHINAMSVIQDEELAQAHQGFKFKNKAFEVSSESVQGVKPIKINYLDEALDNLEELYTKTSAVDDLARIKGIKKQLAKDGVDLQEANNIAREYNIEFGAKAFKEQTGEALTSVNAQQYENIRKGLKESVRNLMPDDFTKQLDESMSNAFTVKRLANQLVEKVNTANQRIMDSGLLQKIASKAGKVFNMLTGNSVKEILKTILPAGITKIDYLAIEKALSKNIKLFNKVISSKNDTELFDSAVDLAKQAEKTITDTIK